MWIKICGITNSQDADDAVQAGADALGFVFAESARKVDAASVRAIAAAVLQQIEKVGVFVDQDADAILDTVIEAGLTAVQLHGHESLEFARALHGKLALLSSPVKLIRASRAPLFDAKLQERLGWDPMAAGIVELDPHTAEPRPGVFSALLVDSGSTMQPGGTGETFDWHGTRALLGMMQGFTKVIVAGGLTPANVARAVELFHPWGVDVSTGVEREPGKKDPEKVRTFVGAARAAERRL
ncbi:MAG TPA: phosphoribosylanthranilate isomerase [Terriglobales bacterium]|jgi:phosphoribosylanthranilate isomerase|nr:phosphoribosylanthranilate isomerase [Terriglobales bacterium]